MYRFLLLAALALGSCAPAYVPNSRNVPMFAEGGEFAGAVVLSSGVEGQMAYAVNDHVAVMANAMVIPKKLETRKGVSYNKDGVFGEGGLGYFTKTKAYRFETFAGYGVGQGNSFESFYFFGSNEVIANGKYQRVFIQPSIGTNKRKFNILFTTRVSMVNFTKFTTTDPTATSSSVKPTDKFKTIIEPSLTTRFPIMGNLRGFFQLNLNTPVGDVYFKNVVMQAAVGVQLHTGQLRTRVY